MVVRRLLVVIILVGTVLIGGAGAHTSSNQDPNDTASPFDLRKVGLTHNAQQLKGKAITYGAYPKSELVPQGNRFYLGLDTDTDPKLDFYVSMFAKQSGALVAKVYKKAPGKDPLQGNGNLTRSTTPGGDSMLTVEISRAMVGAPVAGQDIRYRWYTKYSGNQYDYAPDTGWYKMTI
jgi:hypothetical protein